MRPRDFAFAGSSYFKMWAGLNGFDPGNNLALGGYCYFKAYAGTRNLKAVQYYYTNC